MRLASRPFDTLPLTVSDERGGEGWGNLYALDSREVQWHAPG